MITLISNMNKQLHILVPPLQDASKPEYIWEKVVVPQLYFGNSLKFFRIGNNYK